MGGWTVWRRGPGRRDAWRKVYTGDEDGAKRRYHRERLRLRQGHAVLADGTRPVCTFYRPATGR